MPVTYLYAMSIIKWEIKTGHIVGTIPKFNRKNRRKRGKIDISR